MGIVHRRGGDCRIEIDAAYRDAMLGLEGFSHIEVLYWLHENDTPDKRAILQVRPRRNQANPLAGVFATHSPVRPNLIGLCRCRIPSIDKNLIRVDTIDARDRSPVIDIKCFIPDKEPLSPVRLPAWA